VIIPAGEFTTELLVQPIGPGITGEGRTVILTLVDAPAYDLAPQAEATVTIVEDLDLPDLAVNLDEVDWPGILVPGERMRLDVQIDNVGTAAADGRTTIQIFLLPSGANGPTPNDLPVGEITRRIRLQPDESRTVTVRIDVPDDIELGEYRLVAVVDPFNEIAERRQANNTAFSEPVEVLYMIGQVEDRVIRRLDIDGVRYQLTGPGSARILPGENGQAPTIMVEDSAANTRLLVRGQRNVDNAVHNIFIAGSARDVRVLNARIEGDIVTTGGLQMVRADEFGSAQQRIVITDANGDGRDFSLRGGDVENLSIESNLPIRMINVNAWDDTDDQRDLITAPSITRVQVRNDFGADMDLLDEAGDGLTRLRVGGLLSDSVIRSAANIGNVQAGGFIDSTIFAGVDPMVDLVTSADDFVAVRQIQNVQVIGSRPVTFQNTRIAASTIGRITLREIETDNDDVPMGITAQNIGQYRRLNEPVRRDLATPGIVEELGDYTLRIV
jgi:hypothetical protein